MRRRIVHLVDDTTAGGVMRVLEFLKSSAGLAEQADHVIQSVDRGKLWPGRFQADMIVSHLAISWRALPMLQLLRLRHAGIPVVHVEHSYTEKFVELNVPNTGRFARLLKLSYGLFSTVVAVSHAQGKWLADAGFVKQERLVVIQSCVDLAAFRALNAAPRPPRVLGAIGRLDRQKGFDLVIEALRHVPDLPVSLHFYGEGDQEARLKELAKGDARIEFRGFCPDPVQAMEQVDAVVMPSSWEAYGLVAIEALSAERPLLVNAIDGLLDHRAYGATVVPSGSAESWAEAITQLVTGAPDAQHRRKVPELEREFERSWNALIDDLCGRCEAAA